MITRRAFLTGLMMVCVAFSANAKGPDVDGKIDRVIDGNTFLINGVRVRLMGIDVPRESTALGRAVKEKVFRLWSQRRAFCFIAEKGTDGVIARCFVLDPEGSQDMSARDMAAILLNKGIATAQQ